MTTEKQNKKLIKTEDRGNKIKRATQWLTESFDASDVAIMEEYADLKEKNKLTPTEEKRKDELRIKIAMIHGLKNGIWLGNLSYEKYFCALVTMRSSLIKEHDCKTSLEFMLVDRIVASYWRAMKYDMYFNHLTEKEDGSWSYDQLKINALKEFNKGIELANRQLNANIILLKELKQPKLNVNVKTKTAFVAQNQQFNVNKQDDQQNENIEPK